VVVLLCLAVLLVCPPKDTPCQTQYTHTHTISVHASCLETNPETTEAPLAPLSTVEANPASAFHVRLASTSCSKVLETRMSAATVVAVVVVVIEEVVVWMALGRKRLASASRLLRNYYRYRCAGGSTVMRKESRLCHIVDEGIAFHS